MSRSTRHNAANKEAKNFDTANEQNANLENITLADIYKVITQVDDKVSTLSSKFDSLDNRTSKLENENKKLKEDITALRSRLSTAEFGVNQVQQKQFEKYITISNIPQIENENLAETVIKAINLLQVEINQNNITYCKRIVAKGNNVPLIVAEFDTLELKETILEFAKTSGPILPEQLYPVGTFQSNSNRNPQKIFFKQYITSYTHKLLQEAKKLRVNYTIAYIWQNSGIVFLRLTPKSKIFKLKSFQDLDSFITSELNTNN